MEQIPQVASTGYWSPVNREVTLTLDDLLLEGSKIAPFSRAQSDHTAMGRLGNVMLMNTANVRVFNVRADVPLATVIVLAQPSEHSFAQEFSTLRHNPELEAERVKIAADIDRPPDKTLALIAEMPGMGHHGGGHQVEAIEWEDTMEMMNRMSSPENMFWKLVDRATGAINQDIHWSFTVGDQVKIRIVNEPGSDHPMQHPIHFHGQRFLVLSRDGIRNENLAWKDTVLVPRGQTVDILVDMSNPGAWMVHCHIAEHLEGGMMFTYHVQ